MSALIRLANKYQIEDVEKRALSALSLIFTSYRWRRIHVETQSSEEDRVFAIAAVNLARLTNTPSVLPSAFYHCALLGSKVLSGFAREYGTVEYLSEDDLGRCMDGIAKLTAATASSKLSLALSAEGSCADSCVQVGLCAVAPRSVSTSIKEDVLHFHAPPDALGG